MTIFHRLQGSLVMHFNFFTFLFTLAKSDIYPQDVTVILQIVIQVQHILDQPKLQLLRMGPGLYFLKMSVNLSQYCGTVGLFSTRSIVKRSKVNSFVTPDYKNNTYIACSLIFVNKLFLFLSLFSVLSFLRIMYQKTTGSSLL